MVRVILGSRLLKGLFGLYLGYPSNWIVEKGSLLRPLQHHSGICTDEADGRFFLRPFSSVLGSRTYMPLQVLPAPHDGIIPSHPWGQLFRPCIYRRLHMLKKVIAEPVRHENAVREVETMPGPVPALLRSGRGYRLPLSEFRLSKALICTTFSIH